MALLVVLAVVSAAQDAPRGLAGPDDGFEFGPRLSTVEIRDRDARVDGLLADAKDAELAGNFEKATELYAEAARTAPANHVVRVARRTWLGTREFVKTRIRKWPANGMKTYRRLTDPRAASLLARGRGGEIRPLLGVAREYPLGSHGPAALLLLADRALVRGDLDQALRHLLEIIYLFEEEEIPGVERAEVLARAGLAAAKTGDRLLLGEMRTRAERLGPDATVRVAGEPESLAAFLARLELVPRALTAPEGWTTAGGTPGRTGGRDGPDGPLTRYWTWYVPGADPTDPNLRSNDQGSPRIQIHPLIAAGHVIVPGWSSVYGFPLPRSPVPPSGFQFMPRPAFWFPGGADDYVINSVLGAPPLFATVRDGIVSLPFRDTDYNGGGHIDSELETATLVTLDLGRQLLQIDQRGGVDPLHETRYDDITFHGAPAVIGGRIFVAGTRMSHLVETMVFCFDAGGERGRLRPLWETWVSMGSGYRKNPIGAWSQPGLSRMPASSVAVKNGIVFVCTNTGVVSALDAETGEILWLHTYEQADRSPDLYTREIRATRTWFPCPPMLDNRLLYVTPLDSDQLLIFFQRPEISTGYVLHDRFGRDEVMNGFDPEYLIGVRDGVAFLAGSTRTTGESPLFAVKAAPAFPGDGESAGDQQRILWRAAIEEDAPRGRGVLAGDAIYFPTRKGIYRVAVADGSVTRLVGPPAPKPGGKSGEAGEAEEDEDPEPDLEHLIGNLAVSGPWLISAGESTVTLFGPGRPDGGGTEK